MTQTHSISIPRSLDPTFAQDGVLTLPIPGIAGDEAAAVLALPDAKLLVAIPLTGANAPVAIARLNDDGSLDETMAVSDGDVVLVPKGHHPCGAPYGYEMYYLNVMAGPRRNWRVQNDPDHDWIYRRDNPTA